MDCALELLNEGKRDLLVSAIPDAVAKGSPPEIHAGGIWALPEWLLHPPPRTQTGTLGHFVSEKVPQTIRTRV